MYVWVGGWVGGCGCMQQHARCSSVGAACGSGPCMHAMVVWGRAGCACRVAARGRRTTQLECDWMCLVWMSLSMCLSLCLVSLSLCLVSTGEACRERPHGKQAKAHSSLHCSWATVCFEARRQHRSELPLPRHPSGPYKVSPTWAPPHRHQ